MSREHGVVAWWYVGTPGERVRCTAVLVALWVLAAVRYVLIVVGLCLLAGWVPLWWVVSSVVPADEVDSNAVVFGRVGAIVLLVAVVVGVLLAVVLLWRRRRRFERRALRAIDAVPLDGPGAALVGELLEELAIAAGCTPPRSFVVESEAMNAMGIGTTASTMTVVVTRGLLAMPRPELEAVLAYEVALITSGDVRLSTSIVALTAGSDMSWLRLGLRTWALRQSASHRDRVANSLTRDPDALVRAFSTIASDPGMPRGLTVEDVPLWLEFPAELAIPFNDRHYVAIRDAVSLERRIAAIESLD